MFDQNQAQVMNNSRFLWNSKPRSTTFVYFLFKRKGILIDILKPEPVRVNVFKVRKNQSQVQR